MKKEQIRRKKKAERRIRQKKDKQENSIWERFGHETGRHGSVRSKNQIDLSRRTRCVVLKQSWRSEGTSPGTLELPSWNRLHTDKCFGVKWVAVVPFELKLGPNEYYGRGASVKPPPGAKKAQIRAKIKVKLQGSAAWAQPLK